MIKTEVPHNTPEQVREYLQGALEVIDELELDDELRVPAFLKACDLLSGKQLFFDPGTPMLGNPAALRGH